MIETNNLALDVSKFKDDLESAIYMFRTLGIDYRIVGSVGVYSQIPPLASSFQPRSHTSFSGTTYRDIDFIFKQDPSIKSVISDFNKAHGNTRLDGTFTDQKWLTFTDHSAKLSYGRLAVPVPLRTLQPIRAELYGVTFDTLPLPTLIHLAAIQGKMRLRDKSSARVALRWLRTHPTDVPEADYEPYHNFCKLVATRYPFYTWRHAQRVKVSEGDHNLGDTYKKMNPLVQKVQRKLTEAVLQIERAVR